MLREVRCFRLSVRIFRRLRFLQLALRLESHLVQRLGRPDAVTIQPICDAVATTRDVSVPNARSGKLPIAAQSLVLTCGNGAA